MKNYFKLNPMFLKMILLSSIFLCFSVYGSEFNKKGQNCFYRNDFETHCNLQKFACNFKDLNLDFLGLTEEKVFEGKKSCKLSFSVSDKTEGHYCYWKIPLPKVPLCNPTFITLCVFAESHKGKVGIVPAVNGKCFNWIPLKNATFDSSSGKWKKIRVNVYPDIAGVCKRKGIKTEKVYIDSIWFLFQGALPLKVLIYIDDLTVDYLKYNTDMTGSSLSELLTAVKGQVELNAQKARKVNVPESSPYLAKIKNSLSRLKEIETEINAGTDKSRREYAGLRIELDRLSHSSKDALTDIGFEALFVE